MMAGLDKKELSLLRFTKEEAQSQVKWEHSREFEYKDQMYDVVKTEVKGDTIYYWCWLDHQETTLNKKLSQLVAKALGNDPQNSDKEKKFADFVKTLFHSEIPEWDLRIFPGNLTAVFNYSSHQSFFYYSPPVPPPQII
jgi:hypothetical protein